MAWATSRWRRWTGKPRCRWRTSRPSAGWRRWGMCSWCRRCPTGWPRAATWRTWAAGLQRRGELYRPRGDRGRRRALGARAQSDVAYRTNLVTIEDGMMLDYSAGDISSEEAHELIAALNAAVSRAGLKFHGGVSYRHLLIWRDGPTELAVMPPHEISGKPVAEHLPSGPRQEEARALMELSRHVFANHPVNLARIAARAAAPPPRSGCGAMARRWGSSPIRSATAGAAASSPPWISCAAWPCCAVWRSSTCPAPPAGSTRTTPARRRRPSTACALRLRLCARGSARRVRAQGHGRGKGARHREFRPPGGRARLGGAGGRGRALPPDRLHGPPHARSSSAGTPPIRSRSRGWMVRWARTPRTRIGQLRRVSAAGGQAPAGVRLISSLLRTE
jgi:hypothetical protein